MRFVLDNSVLVAWVMNEESTYADSVCGALVEAQAVVPSIWPLEFSNVMVMAQRRGRLTEAEMTRIRDFVLGLPIEVVTDFPPRVLTDVLGLARQHELSVYDASYLDLAMREGLALASLDKRLVDAARRCGVQLFAP